MNKVWGPFFITTRYTDRWDEPWISFGWLKQIEYPYRTGTGVRFVLGWTAIVIGLCRKHKHWGVRDAGGFYFPDMEHDWEHTEIGELARGTVEEAGDLDDDRQADADRSAAHR